MNAQYVLCSTVFGYESDYIMSLLWNSEMLIGEENRVTDKIKS